MKHRHYLIATTLFACYANSPEQAAPKQAYDEAAFNWTRTLAEVTHKISEKHMQLPEKVEECWAEAINAFVMCMDPHSGFLSPKAYKEITQMTSGSFGGIGIVIDNTRQPKDKHLTIIDTIAGGPADQKGILPLDKIVEISGDLLEGITTEEATAKLKGKPGTEVEIKVLRDNFPELITVTITRDIIKEQNSLCFYLPDQQIYYVSLNQFTQNAMKQIEELLLKSKQHPYKGLILDVRSNSGGLLTAAIDIVGMFTPKGSLVVETKGAAHKQNVQYHTSREPIIDHSLPIFILTNNYTASAAEILAGCLREHSRMLSKEGSKKQLMVFLLGSRTFGKGSVQEIIPVSNNSAVKLTTALYYLPGDLSIQGVGIEPDFVVERMLPQTDQMKWFTKSHGRENAMQNYIKTEASKQHTEKEKEKEEQKKKEPKHKKWAERSKEALTHDNQFKAAITLINTLDMAHSCFAEKVNTREKALTFLHQIFVQDKPIVMNEISELKH